INIYTQSMSSLFLQSLIEKAKETPTIINSNSFNNESNNNKYDTKNTTNKHQFLDQTIDNLNKEIEDLENEIRLLSNGTGQIEELQQQNSNIDTDNINNMNDNNNNNNIDEIENIKLLLNKFLQKTNKNYQHQKYDHEDMMEESEENLYSNYETEKKFKNETLIKHNQLMENLTGYKINYGMNKVYLDEPSIDDNKINSYTAYIFKGQCNNIFFKIEFVVNNNNNSNNNTPFVKDLIIKVPLLYQLNFRNLLNHCTKTKSLGLLLNSFQKTSKTLLKRNQFFNSLFISLSNKKQQEKNELIEEISNSFIYDSKIISIPGGYYSNSFIFHPDHVEPIFYLYWDIKYDIVEEQIKNDIQVIANPLLYSKNQVDQIQLILNSLSAYSKMNNSNLNNLSDLIIIGFIKQNQDKNKHNK
ncbi:hypothetical protein DICPUDRAFT_158377, partial [Dictyostelium purpureum]